MTAVPQLAKRFDQSSEAIIQKLRRLGIYGLNVVGAKIDATTTIEAQKVLPSLEEVLKLVAGALDKATDPGLGKTEMHRSGTIVCFVGELVANRNWSYLFITTTPVFAGATIFFAERKPKAKAS